MLISFIIVPFKLSNILQDTRNVNGIIPDKHIIPYVRISKNIMFTS